MRFTLLRDLPGVPAGTIYQLKEDTRYVPETNTPGGTANNVMGEIARSVVEGNDDWFQQI